MFTCYKNDSSVMNSIYSGQLKFFIDRPLALPTNIRLAINSTAVAATVAYYTKL
jgi:hypothetical protein